MGNYRVHYRRPNGNEAHVLVEAWSRQEAIQQALASGLIAGRQDVIRVVFIPE